MRVSYILHINGKNYYPWEKSGKMVYISSKTGLYFMLNHSAEYDIQQLHQLSALGVIMNFMET